MLVALNLVVDKAFAGTLETGSVATLEYADRARVIPQTLLESTLVMVAYATWSNLRASGRIAHARRAVDQALRWTLALSAAPVAGMFIGRHVLVSLLYERGAFTAEDTAATAGVLAWYLRASSQTCSASWPSERAWSSGTSDSSWGSAWPRSSRMHSSLLS